VYALGSRNTDMRLGEYIFLKYHLFPFFSADTNLTIQPYFVPTVAALTIAAATYFLIARLVEHKKESAQSTE
jgi:4-amino-4-deoxy-L-arabinose transferase-like glycosyltransferase